MGPGHDHPRTAGTVLPGASARHIEDLLRDFVANADELVLAQERLQALLTAVISVAEDLSLEAVLERVVSSACVLSGARYGALGVMGNERGMNHFVSVGFEDGVAERIGKVPVGRGVLGLLIEDPRPLRLPDLREHPAFEGFPEQHPPMGSFLGVPVRVRDKVFGNLYLTEKSGGEGFTAMDEELVVALAAAAGVAIENAQLFGEARLRGRWLEACMDVGRTLLESPDADERAGFDAVVRRARRESAATLAMIGVPSLGTDKLFCVAADGDGAEALLGRSLGIVPGALCKLRQDGKSVVMESPSAVIEDMENYVPPAPPDGDDPAVGGGGTLVAALGRPGEGQGVLVLVRGPGADAFSPTEIGMSEVFGSHVALALELARAHRLREQQAVFGDRDRIARDLHDLVIQRLFAAGLSMQSLRRFTDDAVALDRIATVTGELDDTIRQLRDTIYSLRGTGSTETSLSSRILRVVQDNPSVHGAARLRFAGPIDVAVGDELAGHLLAVLTEGLSNAARHSQARSVEVSVSAGLGGVQLEVVDDGVGFSTPSRRGGLATMSERAAICGGRMELQSSPGNGTRLSWFVPGPAEEEQPPVRNAAPGRPSPRRPRPGSGAGSPASPA